MCTKNLVIFLMVILSINTTVLSQREDHVWVLGDTAGPIASDSLYCMMAMDFNGDQVTIKPVEPCISSISGANSSIADKQGTLMAFTNGMYIRDDEQQYLVDTIGYDWSLPKNCRDWEYNNYIYSATAPMPNPTGKVGSNNVIMLSIDSTLFAVYTTRNYCIGKTDKLMYSMVRTSGEIVWRDKLLATSNDLRGMVYTIKHGNGRDWWLISLTNDSRKMMVYLVDPSGITFHHVQEIENNITFTAKAVGQMAISPDGSKIAWISGYYYDKTDGTQFFLADFDRCDGTVSGVQYAYGTSPGVGAGIAFSPDSRYLYMTLTYKMYRYDVSRTDALTAGTLVGMYDGFNFLDMYNDAREVNFYKLKLGPDGRMYVFSSGTLCRYMGVIHYPHEALPHHIDLRQHSLYTPRAFFYTVPNMPEYRIGPLDGSPCDTLGIDNHPVAKYRYDPDTLDYRRIRFTDLSYFRPETWSWDFGDGSPRSSERHPRHTYAHNGTYTVCLTVSNENSSNTTCRTLTIGPSGTGDTGPAVTAVISLLPNPVEDYLLVTLGEYIPEHGQMVLYDISGRPVHTQRIYYGQNNVDMTQLASGIYVWKVMDGQVEIQSGKVVKM